MDRGIKALYVRGAVSLQLGAGGDHCSNIAARLVGMEAGEDYDSHTLKNMMHHNPTKEYMLNYEQCRKDYLIPLEQLEA